MVILLFWYLQPFSSLKIFSIWLPDFTITKISHEKTFRNHGNTDIWVLFPSLKNISIWFSDLLIQWKMSIKNHSINIAKFSHLQLHLSSSLKNYKIRISHSMKIFNEKSFRNHGNTLIGELTTILQFGIFFRYDFWIFTFNENCE